MLTQTNGDKTNKSVIESHIDKMMKIIAVMGATGRTGRPFVAKALDVGHHVKALVRHADAAKDLAEGKQTGSLEIIPGDIDNQQGFFVNTVHHIFFFSFLPSSI
jgi:uncharacterized protein YbjT (DUF2867 family)